MKAAELRAMIEAAKAERVKYKRRALARAVAEHGEALVALLEACEARNNLPCDDRCNPSGWFHTSVCEARLSAADRAIDDATAAVHAIGRDRAEHIGCVYPAGQKCRGVDRCQFPSRCTRDPEADQG